MERFGRLCQRKNHDKENMLTTIEDAKFIFSLRHLIDYPGIKAVDVKCCYLFVLSADGSRASKSVYVPLV